MTYRIGQIPTHNVTPTSDRLIELENPVGPASEYASLRETLHNIIPGGIGLDTTSQLIGLTSGNIAEVEAATRALRVTLRDDDFNIPGWKIGRYQAGVAHGVNTQESPLTGATIDQGVVALFWIPTNGPGFAVIKRITVSLITAALSGARNGTCKMEVVKIVSELGDGTGRGNALLPTSNISVAGKPLVLGLSNRQTAPQLGVNFANTASAILGSNTALEGQAFATIEGGAKNLAGSSQFVNELLWDYRVAEMPLICTTCWGALIRLTMPAAVTSQTFHFCANVTWDEWVPAAPIGS